MKVIVVKGLRSAHEDAVDYGCLSESDNGASDSDVDDKLKKKNREMPAQACTNELELAPIPPELQNLSDLE